MDVALMLRVEIVDAYDALCGRAGWYGSIWFVTVGGLSLPRQN